MSALQYVWFSNSLDYFPRIQLEFPLWCGYVKRDFFLFRIVQFPIQFQVILFFFLNLTTRTLAMSLRYFFQVFIPPSPGFELGFAALSPLPVFGADVILWV